MSVKQTLMKSRLLSSHRRMNYNKKIEKMYLSWDQLFLTVFRIKEELCKRERDFTNYTLYPVVRGGLVPGTLLSHLLSIPRVVPITFQSRDNAQTVTIPDIKEKKCIIVEDIVDTGKTAHTLHPYFPEDSLFTCIIKRKETPIPFKHAIHGIDSTADWVVFPWELS